MSDVVGPVFHGKTSGCVFPPCIPPLPRLKSNTVIVAMSRPQSNDEIDSEVRMLLSSSYARATKLLLSKRRELDMLANALLEHETLSGSEIKEVLKGKKLKPAIAPATKKK